MNLRYLIFAFFCGLGTGHVLCSDFEPITVENVESALEQLSQVPEAHRATEAYSHRAAAINRLLMQLSSDHRYQLLERFTFSGDSESTRAVLSLVDFTAPPKEFARLIGERPRDTVFATPTVANIRGLFSTAWLLVDAAKDSGRIRVLANKVETLSGTDSTVLRTLLLADQPGNQDQVQSALEQFADGLSRATESDANQRARDAAVLSCVCRELEACRGSLEKIRNVVRANPIVSSATKALIARTEFSTQQQEHLTPFQINEDWIAVGDHGSLFSDGNHVTHVPGGDVYYVYRYPLAGEFRFLMQQSRAEPDDDSQIEFGGRAVALEHFSRPKTNLREIEVAGDRFRHWLNGYRLGDFSNESTCPWVAVRPNSLAIDRFRSMRLTGSPTVPREVRLIGDKSILGWTSSDPEIELSASKGVLESAKSKTSRQRLVRHMRPLQSAETFEYEYFASDDHAAHPAIGSLVFLLTDAGVKMHWVTAGDNDWTGLRVDNELVEPLSRRGPKQLPFRANDWNRVLMSLNQKALEIRLNDTLVYSRIVQPNDDTRIGWYHNPSEQSMRVRNAVLRGDWPSELDLREITKPSGNVEPSAIAKAVFQERDPSDGVLHVIDEASRLTPEDRYNYLADWVLPNDWHTTLRLTSDFTTLLPASAKVNDGHVRDGQLVSPALELIDVAVKADRLDQLVEKLASYSPDDIHQKRNLAAMLALTQLRRNNPDEALKQVEALFSLNEECEQAIGAKQLWPDYLVSHELVDVPQFSDIVRDLLTMYQLPQLDPEMPITYELSRLWNVSRKDDLQEFSQRPAVQLKQWLPTAHYSSKSRSLGRGGTSWLSIAGGVRHIASHRDDMLFFASPLDGDYEVQFDRQNAEFTDVHVLAGGTRIKLDGADAVITGDDERSAARTPIVPPLELESFWSRHRYVVRNGVLSVYVNGRKTAERKVTEDNPWLALCAPDNSSGAVRNLQVLGAPTIPGSVDLVHPGMTFWRSYFVDSNDENAKRSWHYRDGSIIGEREEFPEGCGRERLLYYQRPLMGNDAVEYEFFYTPGETLVHPALDRTAFVIDPNAIQLHDITDGLDARMFSNKTNLRVEPSEQRDRPESVLKENQWNKARVSLSGDQLELHLNGSVVSQHQLSPANQRLFGFFYFSDQCSARVRNVVLHGSWPTKLPAATEQQLVDPQLADLDFSRDKLNGRIQRKLGEEVIPNKLFAINGATSGTYRNLADGLALTVPGAAGQKQSGITSRFQVSGDFDISADFANFQPELTNGKNGHCSIRMDVVLEGENLPRATIQRFKLPSRQTVNATFTIRGANGRDTRLGQPIDWESNSGTFRIARRGDKMFMLIKEADALGFRLIRTHQVPTTPCSQIRLMTVAANAKSTSVTWKALDIRADNMANGGNVKPKPPRQEVIFIANADGTGLRQIEIGEKAQGHNGSPHLSPDAKRIAFHAGPGNPSGSRVFVVNSDGTNLTDLGRGSLPMWISGGRQIAFCSPEWDLSVMNADGSAREVIYQRGWGIQVSPDGKEALFKDFQPGGSSNLTVMNLKTKQKRRLLFGDARRYRNLYWSYSWSPDGQWISFYGARRDTGKHEFALVSAKGSDHSFRVLKSDADDFYPRTSWHPDGDRILIGRRSTKDKYAQYVLKLSDQDYCEPLFEMPIRMRAAPAAWSSDGSQIVFMGTVLE